MYRFVPRAAVCFGIALASRVLAGFRRTCRGNPSPPARRLPPARAVWPFPERRGWERLSRRKTAAKSTVST